MSDTMLEIIKNRFGEQLLAAEEVENELRLTVAAGSIRPVAVFLRSEPSLAFDYPADLAGCDTGENIVLWYRLVSISNNRTVLMHVDLPYADPVIDSVSSVWPGMNWHEREVFDLFGVRFTGHPDDGNPEMMRILLPEDWVGHPFRRGYVPEFSGNPLHGPQERN